MADINKLKEILEGVPYPVLIQVVDNDVIWYRDGSELYWNEEFNSEDLYNQDGITYSGCMREGGEEWDGYLVTNLDISVGTMITYFFPLDKEIKLEDLEKMYE